MARKPTKNGGQGNPGTPRKYPKIEIDFAAPLRDLPKDPEDVN